MAARVNNSLLPYNATAHEQALEAVTARVSDVPVVVRDVWNPETCPADLLPWLASAFSVDAWDASWSEAQKRQAIAESVFVHRHKGTIGAVRRALAALGFGAQVQEWFNQTPAGDPYTYRLLLEVDQVGIDQAALAKILQVVDATKNLRSHLSEIVPIVVSRAWPVMAAVAGMGCEIVVQCAVIPDFNLLLEGATNGVTPTEAAVDLLHVTVNQVLPTTNSMA